MKQPSEIVALVHQLETSPQYELSPGLKGSLLACMDKLFGRDGRVLVFQMLWDVKSSKNLTDEQWNALKQWIGMHQVGEEWYPRESWAEEYRTLYEVMQSPMLSVAIQHGGQVIKRERYMFDG